MCDCGECWVCKERRDDMAWDHAVESAFEAARDER